jgi:phosphoglucosamine mutase
MALIASRAAAAGTLRGGALVATVMSNLGLERFLAGQGIGMLRAAVGDRHVLELMREHGCNLGGEQSGHIILSEYCTTGDGLIAALQILSILVQSNKRMSDIGHTFEAVPQILQSISTKNFIDLDQDRIQKVIQDASEKLESNGRLLIRKSGTEPVIRIMAQGDDQALLKSIVQDIVETIQMVDSKAA